VTEPTGLDNALKLEAVYYSAPVPRDLATLTVLGAVFDKVYFPGVYLPTGGFDQGELDREIERIVEATRGKPSHNPNLIGILRFIKHAKTLQGFCVFTSDGEICPNDVPHRMVDDLYQAIHGPYPEGWHPDFRNVTSKAIPGSQKGLLYPGDYHYLTGALLHSAKSGIPLLNDTPGLPVPLIFSDGQENDRAKHLATMLAIECAKLALPELPLLWPEDLMEFREQNRPELRVFRRSLLRYAGELNAKLTTVPPEEIEVATKFLVLTEIVPALDELRAKMNAPARPWYKRAIDAVQVIPKVSPAFYTMDVKTIIGAVLAGYLPQAYTELSAIGEKREILKKSGLYYLLRLETYQGSKQPKV
jgi:hypothetical protein